MREGIYGKGMRLLFTALMAALCLLGPGRWSVASAANLYVGESEAYADLQAAADAAVSGDRIVLRGDTTGASFTRAYIGGGLTITSDGGPHTISGAVTFASSAYLTLEDVRIEADDVALRFSSAADRLTVAGDVDIDAGGNAVLASGALTLLLPGGGELNAASATGACVNAGEIQLNVSGGGVYLTAPSGMFSLNGKIDIYQSGGDIDIRSTGAAQYGLMAPSVSLRATGGRMAVEAMGYGVMAGDTAISLEGEDTELSISASTCIGGGYLYTDTSATVGSGGGWLGLDGDSFGVDVGDLTIDLSGEQAAVEIEGGDSGIRMSAGGGGLDITMDGGTLTASGGSYGIFCVNTASARLSGSPAFFLTGGETAAIWAENLTGGFSGETYSGDETYAVVGAPELGISSGGAGVELDISRLAALPGLALELTYSPDGGDSWHTAPLTAGRAEGRVTADVSDLIDGPGLYLFQVAQTVPYLGADFAGGPSAPVEWVVAPDAPGLGAGEGNPSPIYPGAAGVELVAENLLMGAQVSLELWDSGWGWRDTGLTVAAQASTARIDISPLLTEAGTYTFRVRQTFGGATGAYSALCEIVVAELPTYTVRLGGGAGGEVTSSHTAARPGEQVVLTVRTNSGYAFSSWSVRPGDLAISGGGTTYTFTMPWQDVEITPVFTRLLYTVTVQQQTGGGVTASGTSSYAGEPVYIYLREDEGYVHTGWQTTPAGLVLAGGDGVYTFTMPAGNVTITPVFSELVYTVRFDTGGGSGIDPRQVAHGALLAEPSPPTRAGHTFTGWYLDSGCTQPYAFTEPVTEDLTLYAGWAQEPPAEEESYTVIYSPNGGIGDEYRVEQAEGRHTVLDRDYTRVSHIFWGWSTDPSAPWEGDVLAAGDTVDLDVGETTLYAVWKPLPFRDSPHYAYIVGDDDGLVRPEDNLTRAEAATILFRLLDDDIREASYTAENTFPDVAVGDWHNKAVSTIARLGYIQGYTDGSYHPDDNITRGELINILAKMAGSTYTGEDYFTDIDDWYREPINLAASLGWVTGYGDGTCRPDSYISRAETVVLLNSVLDRNPPDGGHLLDGMIVWQDNLDTSEWYYLDIQEATNSHSFTRDAQGVETWSGLIDSPDWLAIERPD